MFYSKNQWRSDGIDLKPIVHQAGANTTRYKLQSDMLKHPSISCKILNTLCKALRSSFVFKPMITTKTGGSKINNQNQ